ncbi:MAG: hypothetical protein UT05_C0007G0023 [Parcubacteria group bacterium GW2011_GWF2_38_76]|nr:MAG: hypothetical protein UT05_C0007G0023 [Parcubacteria group bacterium GW2011_GWF2_38_76]HBM46100.1 hypothetical protein [Patescibacteria group bacterium]
MKRKTIHDCMSFFSDEEWKNTDLRVVYCCSFSEFNFYGSVYTDLYVGQLELPSIKTKYQDGPLVLYNKSESETNKNIQLEINRIFDEIFEEAWAKRQSRR